MTDARPCGRLRFKPFYRRCLNMTHAAKALLSFRGAVPKSVITTSAAAMLANTADLKKRLSGS